MPVEAWILVALLLLLCLRVSVLPITGWDGRSVWLFHAKQLWFQKMMALSDLHHPDWEWSHPVYPFLVPGVMASFGGGGSAFNERTAALAVPVLWGASLLVLWSLLREHAGRAASAAIAVTLFFGMQQSVGELYMDALVAVLLAIVVLAIASPQRLRLALLAAFVVSLVKVEGAIAAALILGGWAAFELIRGRRSWATAALLIPLALPLVHRVWLSANDVTEFQASLSLSKTIEAVPSRLPVLAAGVPRLLVRDATPQQIETQALIRLGTLGLVFGVVLVFIGKERSAVKTLVLSSGVVLALLAVFATSAMPQDAAWLVAWTLDRLMLHPAVMFLLISFI
jgi:hypothetical protein